MNIICLMRGLPFQGICVIWPLSLVYLLMKILASDYPNFIKYQIIHVLLLQVRVLLLRGLYI